MKMLNGNICCKSLDQITETIGNVIVPTKDKSYKTLKVMSSNEDIVGEGKIIYVPLNSGNDVEVGNVKYTIVNVREIILILD